MHPSVLRGNFVLSEHASTTCIPNQLKGVYPRESGPRLRASPGASTKVPTRIITVRSIQTG